MIVGLTGGIGSGKTTVAGMFLDLGIPVYIADDRAKILMTSDNTLKNEIINLLGKEAYQEDRLNRSYIAEKVFSNSNLLQKLNSLVHPVVDKDFQKWAAEQLEPYVVKEAAILFENNGYKKCDFTIVVTAPLALRIKRVVDRDGTTETAIKARMDNQWSDLSKLALADAHIDNTSLAHTEKQVNHIHKHILRRIDQGW